jgi:hypothetical protein
MAMTPAGSPTHHSIKERFWLAMPQLRSRLIEEGPAGGVMEGKLAATVVDMALAISMQYTHLIKHEG